MQIASSGGRRLRHAALAARAFALEAERTVTRKELAAAAYEAEVALVLRPSARQILSALVASWGEQAWERLLVWPSNEYLANRTGYTERAIRFALNHLIEQGLIIPKDSPNGKRYAVKDLAGEIIDAFGFDLTPVYARRGEWARLVAEQKQARAERKRLFDEITVSRRQTEAAIEALALHHPTIDRTAIEEQLKSLLERTPKRSSQMMPLDLAEAWETLRKTAEKLFYEMGNEGIRFRHNESNNEAPSETCTRGFPKKAEAVLPKERPAEHLSPALIIEACPALKDYGQPIRDIGDIVAAGRYLRASLGAHESAWNEAVADLGPIGAAVAVLYVLQLYEDDVASGANRIRNPGGYYRALVRMVKARKLDLETELLAMRRRRMS
ncbi:plasmid replication protein RepC [Microvirga rosea]|uniref:plasmid replication protein RepC n=1 Tax=Microvirga rosea TaxID=2715425 RepID=UPI001D0ADE43|nr:plasmid replication protein RepC [Microvirga rosea]MCB8823522.1 helix-turn-helix domain-containing protein [Microvirga rosea]